MKILNTNPSTYANGNSDTNFTNLNKILTAAGAEGVMANLEAAMKWYASFANMPIDDTERALNFLNLKADTIRRQIGYYDILNLTSAIDNANIAQQQIDNLSNNSAAVVNLSEVTYNNISYPRGTLIYRDYTGKLSFIENESTGYYYPSHINKTTEGNNFILSYTYASQTPVNSTEGENLPTGSNPPLSTPYTRLNAELNIESETNIYGDTGSLATTSIKIPVKTRESQIIQPIIYYYYSSSNGYERIILDTDYSIVENNTKIQLAACPSLLSGEVIYMVK